jgi:hypothetical protein
MSKIVERKPNPCFLENNGLSKVFPELVADLVHGHHLALIT